MTGLPEALKRAVEARLGRIQGARPVGGGCIASALRLELASGPVFLKYDAGSGPHAFRVEAEGLRRLRAVAAGLRVPEVVAVAEQDGEAGWLALEWLEPGARTRGFGRRLGEGLAALHRAGGVGWGWATDGFIGSLPQDNAPAATWGEFWRDRRLEPQLRMARAAGYRPGGAAEWERLFAALPQLLEPAERDGPSLLHGDLWGGNVLAVGAGEPALVDPAAYGGHREVDLAMSELFGGFDSDFYSAYSGVWPLQPGYREARRGVYQLFYLLVHVNLFGRGYVGRTAETLRAVVSTT